METSEGLGWVQGHIGLKCFMHQKKGHVMMQLNVSSFDYVCGDILPCDDYVMSPLHASCREDQSQTG